MAGAAIRGTTLHINLELDISRMVARFGYVVGPDGEVRIPDTAREWVKRRIKKEIEFELEKAFAGAGDGQPGQ